MINDEPILGEVHQRVQLRKKRTRDRGNETWYTMRRNNITVPRVYPCYVDMARLSLAHSVRYDTKRDVYDLADAMKTAYGSVRPVRKQDGKANPNYGLLDSEFIRLKWSDDGNNGGTGRIMASATTCARVLRNSLSNRSRVSPLSVEQTAIWFETQANCKTQPTFLPATFSQSAIDNARN